MDSATPTARGSDSAALAELDRTVATTRTSGDPTLDATVLAWAAHPDRCVIFDFNGTLSDDEPILLRLYTEMFLERLHWTLTPRHYYQRYAGRSDREIIDIVVEELNGFDDALASDLLAERRRRYCTLVEKNSPIREDTVATVQGLADRGIRQGIVTGAQRIDVQFVLDHSPLGAYFPVIVTEEDVQRGKPDPQGFQLGAEQMGVDPAAVLVFEDSLFGVQAAKAAGMACIAVEGTRSRDELEGAADAVVARISPTVFAALASQDQR